MTTSKGWKRWIEYGGQRRSLTDTARHAGISIQLLAARLDRGLPIEQAVLPARKKATR